MAEQMILRTATGLSLGDEINRAHDAVVSSLNDAVAHATECRRLLLEAKTKCKHGEWLPWLEQNFKGSQRTARNYMKLETAKRQRIADLGEDSLPQYASINEALRMISGVEDVHPITEMVPMMTEVELQSLAANIGRYGLLEPIVTFQGMILDGRCRKIACEIADVEPRYEAFTGTELEAIHYVYSMNVVRQSLTPDQLACVRVELNELVADKP